MEEGHAVEVAVRRGGRARRASRSDPAYDLVVLDVMLPKRDGFDVLKTLRERRVQTPVLLLTARDGVADKVAGPRPRARTTTSPSRSPSRSSWRGCGRSCGGARAGPSRALQVARPLPRSGDPRGHAGRRRITLTAREYALLEYFLRNADRVLTRPMITQHVWGLDFDPESNVVDVYVGYLRRKIDGGGRGPAAADACGAPATC